MTHVSQCCGSNQLKLIVIMINMNNRFRIKAPFKTVFDWLPSFRSDRFDHSDRPILRVQLCAVGLNVLQEKIAELKEVFLERNFAESKKVIRFGFQTSKVRFFASNSDLIRRSDNRFRDRPFISVALITIYPRTVASVACSWKLPTIHRCNAQHLNNS